MSTGKEYFLKNKWSIRPVDASQGKSPHALAGVKAGDEIRFSEQGGRIVGKFEKADDDVKDLWKTVSFVYEPVHDRLLGILVHDGEVHTLEVTRWSKPEYPGNWIQCGYVLYEHIPHDKGPELHVGWWHGDSPP